MYSINTIISPQLDRLCGYPSLNHGIELKYYWNSFHLIFVNLCISTDYQTISPFHILWKSSISVYCIIIILTYVSLLLLESTQTFSPFPSR